MADEAAGGEAGVEVPEAEGVVPRRRERELAVRRHDDVRDEVVVAVQDLEQAPQVREGRSRAAKSWQRRTFLG